MQTSDAARGTYCALVRTNSPKPPVGRCLASPPCHEPGHVSVSGCSKTAPPDLTTMSRAGPRIRQRLFHAPARNASRMLLHNSDPSAGWTTGGRLLHEPPNMLPAVAGLTLVVHQRARDPNREGAN
uniref:Uncharacterized protein n=1 Tax=Globodera rostochiensis TaxID=31243 RepID=A0A914HCT5_GLORO